MPAPVPPPLEPPGGQDEGGLHACAVAVPLLSVAQHPVEHSKLEVQRTAHDPSVTRTVFEGHCVDAGGGPSSDPPHAPDNTMDNSRHTEGDVRAIGNGLNARVAEPTIRETTELPLYRLDVSGWDAQTSEPPAVWQLGAHNSGAA